MAEPVPFVLAPRWGEPYRYLEGGEPRGLYRPVAFALDVRTKQDRIVYVGLTGPDRDLWFVAPLDDWTFRFVLYEPEPEPGAVMVTAPAEPVPDRGRAGHVNTGSGA